MEKYRVLIVEDDERIVSQIEDVLASLGHEHEWAANQADAWKLFESKYFDYVLLDMQIPPDAHGRALVECGLNFLRAIRKHKGADMPPVIIMTAYAGTCFDMTRSLIANGARDFIAKPFPETGRTLMTVIRGVLGSEDGEPAWLKVTDCAEMLCKDLPSLPLKQARARISKAAGGGKFKTNGKKGATRRVESVSFNSWRL
jgi:two-component system, NtrC family, nitrogen regulation response regulator NtrX